MSAWSQFYSFGLNAPAGSNLGDAIIAVKRELNYNGFGTGLILALPDFGDAARKRTMDFQRAHGLNPDGVIGPTTALVLFRGRAHNVEATYGIPDSWLCKIKTVESANDPAAIGFVDKDDHGLMQLNTRIHPDVSLADAINPAFSEPWAAQYLTGNHNVLHDWDAAVVSYNVGLGGASAWVSAGKPATGGTKDNPTLYQTATHYLSLVTHASC